MWQIEQLLKILKGTPFRIERESFTGISTDSRSIKEGELFIPLSGINFDGHTFIPSAYDRSKAGSLCEKGREDIAEDVSDIINDYCEKNDTYWDEIDFSYLRDVFAGTWVEEYKDETEEW